MHGADESPRSMHRVRIVDGVTLRSVLEELRVREGSDQKAADWLGIEKYTFTKLRTGNVSRSMSYATYAAILGALGGKAAELWLEPDPIFGSVATDLEVEEEMQRSGSSREQAEAVLDFQSLEQDEAAASLFKRFQDSFLTEDARVARENYDDWLDGELRRLRPLFRKLKRALAGHPDVREPLKRFLKRVRGSSTAPTSGDKRLRLAVYRAIEPLYGAEATWEVERSIHEMREAGELEEYLKAALKREEILLRRERDLVRFAQCVPPVDYDTWLFGPLA